MSTSAFRSLVNATHRDAGFGKHLQERRDDARGNLASTVRTVNSSWKRIAGGIDNRETKRSEGTKKRKLNEALSNAIPKAPVDFLSNGGSASPNDRDAKRTKDTGMSRTMRETVEKSDRDLECLEIGADGKKRPGFLDRVHYDTVNLVHSDAFEWAYQNHKKELIKTRDYDELKESKKAAAASNAGAEKTGDEKVRDLRFWLDNLGLKRHVHQIRFHEHMIRACLQKIYEKEWATQYETIMKKFEITKMRREMLFSCPRRFGKTWAVAVFAAAYLLSISNCDIALFSTGKRTAKKVMILILSFLKRYPGFEEKIVTKNHEELVLQFGDFDARKLFCYPSAVNVR
jgi:Probable DNA packing protein, N-terminus